MKSKVKSKVKPKHLVTLLIVLIVVLILLFSFSVYKGLRTEETKEEAYVAEGIIEEKDIIPEETAEIPTVEEGEEEVEVLNEVTITIKNLRFEPEKITIAPGTTVIWFNKDTTAHKVVAYDRLFYGPRMAPGDKYAFTFTKEGTHRYFDAVFPKIGRGQIVVKEEPLPITGQVIAIDFSGEGDEGKFGLLVLLFVVMIFGLSHGMYKHHKI